MTSSQHAHVPNSDRIAIDAIAHLLVLVDVTDPAAPTVATVSASWSRAHGGVSADWVGRPAVEVLPPSSRQHLFHGGGQPLVFDDVTLAGAPVEVTMRRTEADGSSYVLWEGRDVREQRRSERQQRAVADDLRRSNSDLAEFASVASHDLKEPLRMVTAYLELLDRRYGDRLDERGRQYLGFASDGAARLRSMTEALLDLAKVRSSPVPHDPVDLAAVMASVRRELEVTLGEAAGELTSGDLPVVAGNATLLQVLLQNLVANAVKFSEGHPHVHVECQGREADWLLTVDDDGIGIAPERRDDAFTMFRRLHPRSAYPGNGMGLALCRGIAGAHGGEIWLDSSPLGGTRASVRLPRVRSLEDTTP